MADFDALPFGADTLLIGQAAKAAGEIALKYFKASENKVWVKSGDSPVSQADREVDAYLKTTLTGERPDYGWLSEETEDDQQRTNQSRVFIVDPIDGTRGFLEGRPEWCISAALVEDGRPISAVLHCPALERTFTAESGVGIEDSGKPCRVSDRPETLRVTGSKKLNALMTTAFAKEAEVIPFIPSLAYRFAMVAAGELDAAFARPGASEWDIAAADLILQEAGGRLSAADGETLIYNKADVRSPALVAGPAEYHGEILSLAKASGILQ